MNELLKDTIVYDCEIKRCIPQKGKTNDPDLEYCQGWTDFIGMGISVVCVYDFSEQHMFTFAPSNPFDKLRLTAYFTLTRCAIGFNNHHFDNKLLNAHGIATPNTYDIFEEIKKQRGQYPKKYNLDAICKANNIDSKTEKEGGALAPILYQRGEFERLNEYCRQDVKMTADVYRMVLDNILHDPVRDCVLRLPRPKQICQF